MPTNFKTDTARSKREAFYRQLKRQSTCCDMFGYKVGFNIEGEEEHKTIPGACCTLLVFVCLFFVFRYTYTEFALNK